MKFNKKEIEEIVEAINQSHYTFIALTISPDVVPKKYKNKIRDILSELGFSNKQIYRYPELHFLAGMLSSVSNVKDLKKLSMKKFISKVRAHEFLPLTMQERYAIKHAEKIALHGITKLSARVANDVNNIFLQSEQTHISFANAVKKFIPKGIKKRRSQSWIVSEIGKASGHWQSDVARIVQFVSHRAYSYGYMAAEYKKNNGESYKVYLRVHSDACKHCKRLYLKSDGIEPRIFDIENLLDNGSNIGRKTSQWKAVIPPIHPHCRCLLQRLLPNYVWDKKKNKFRPKLVGIDFRPRLKTKVTIT